MKYSIRILPVTVVALALIFGLKLSSVWNDAHGFLLGVSIAEVQAEEKDAETAKAPATPDGDTVASVPPSDEAETPKTIVTEAVPQFSESELQVLERLVERRDELDRRSQEIDMRDNLLKVTEARIDEKINELKKMEETLNDLLQLHDEQEKAQMESLVKIYEKMKPKDAARIFNSLEMDILIDVASKIKEAKMASILASMNSQRANKLTVELATRRQLPGIDDKKS
ncbi:MAG: hypothetical protein NXI13_01970 [Proteobacteria bacterium]|nr:hypothetical protein [Pseudomonadota bacterium]